jgi:hypothetical protein
MEIERRSMSDRRNGKDRRRLTAIKRLFSYPLGLHQQRYNPRAEPGERRHQLERRGGWVRLSRWSSVHLGSLKISKFLIPDQHEPTRKL